MSDKNPPVYCIKCKQKTGSMKGQVSTTAKGQKMLKCMCTQCGCRKNMMLPKSQKGGAWWNPTTW
jgi:hypothetical protein